MDKHIGLEKSYYDFSDLQVIFAMQRLEDLSIPRDYGTGAKYTMLEVHTVTLIERNPGITVTEIANLYNRTKSTVSQLISRLENKGLITKASLLPFNKKTRQLSVTKKGTELSGAHVQYDNRMIAKYIDRMLELGISIEDTNTIMRYFDYCRQKKFDGIADGEG